MWKEKKFCLPLFFSHWLEIKFFEKGWEISFLGKVDYSLFCFWSIGWKRGFLKMCKNKFWRKIKLLLAVIFCIGYKRRKWLFYLEEQHERHPLVITMIASFLILVTQTRMCNVCANRFSLFMWQRKRIRNPAIRIDYMGRNSSIVYALYRITCWQFLLCTHFTAMAYICFLSLFLLIAVDVKIPLVEL